MQDFLWKIGLPVSPNYIIDSRESLSRAVKTFGILPFFPNNIRGFSVEEMCSPGLLFGGNYAEGCWEWKGPVIREGRSAYGKFLRRKAGFVSLDLFPDFINFRRAAYPVKPGGMDEMLYEIIRENDSLTSTELRRLIFGKRKRTRWDEVPDDTSEVFVKMKRKSLESPLQRLQMGCWIIISDFEYKKTKSGERYGWGVARYSTPELTFGRNVDITTNRDPETSFEWLIRKMKKHWPPATKSQLIKLLK